MRCHRKKTIQGRSFFYGRGEGRILKLIDIIINMGSKGPELRYGRQLSNTSVDTSRKIKIVN